MAHALGCFCSGKGEMFCSLRFIIYWPILETDHVACKKGKNNKHSTMTLNTPQCVRNQKEPTEGLAMALTVPRFSHLQCGYL